MMIDLIIFTIINIVIKLLEIFALSKAPTINFYLSFTEVVVLIAMFRWNALGIVVGIIPLGINLIVLNASLTQYIIYYSGLIFLLINSLWFYIIPKSKISQHFSLILIYTLTGYFLIIGGRSLVSLVFKYNFYLTFNQFILNEVLSVVIGLIVMAITYLQKTILVDVNAYLLQLHKKDVID